MRTEITMMDKIKILMVMGNTGLGGTQAFVLNLLKNIDLGKFQIDIAVNNEKEDGIGDVFRQYGCNIYILPYFKVYNYFSFVKAWRSFLKQHYYSVIHAHSTNSASIYLKIAKEFGCVTVAHSHSDGYRGNCYQKEIKKFFAKGVGKYADYWFACSDKAAERLFGDEYKSYPRYFEIPNAINAEKYLYDEKKAKEIRTKLGVMKDEFLCGHVGTFSQPKNHAFLIEVFCEVLKRNNKAKLLCCGAGALMPQIKAKAKELGILERIIFPGVVMNINEYMMAMDVFVFPSLFEGFGIAILEAETCGLPVVMSDVIPSAVDLTDLVHRHSLNESASVWADTICDIKIKDRCAYNEVIVNSKYNMRTSAELITSLYQKMTSNI